MIERNDFAKGMALLCVAFNRELSEELVTLYHAMLAETLSRQEWEAAVREAIQTRKFFPTVAELLEPFRTVEDVRTTREAEELFEALADGTGITTYTPHAGDVWNARLVRERYGDVAAEAFGAAGGPGVFAHLRERDVPFVRKRFVEAFTATARESAMRALPAPHSAAALEAAGPGNPGAIRAGDAEVSRCMRTSYKSRRPAQ